MLLSGRTSVNLRFCLCSCSSNWIILGGFDRFYEHQLSADELRGVPARAVLAVEDGVGQQIPVRLDRRPPGQLDEAGGDQWRHNVSGCGGGGAGWTAHTSGAWRYMVSSVRSQWRGRREGGQGYSFGLGRERERVEAGGGVLHPIRTEERSWNGNDSDMKERKETKTEENKTT